jgi:hypothetical protein
MGRAAPEPDLLPGEDEPGHQHHKSENGEAETPNEDGACSRAADALARFCLGLDDLAIIVHLLSSLARAYADGRAGNVRSRARFRGRLVQRLQAAAASRRPRRNAARNVSIGSSRPPGS